MANTVTQPLARGDVKRVIMTNWTKNWTRYRRKGGKTPDAASLVTIRMNAIALNSHFVASEGLEKNRTCPSLWTQGGLGLDFDSTTERLRTMQSRSQMMGVEACAVAEADASR